MPNHKEFSFEDLKTADLFVDALYRSGTRGNAGDDPISKLVGCGNQGGFRFVGSANGKVTVCVLYSSLADMDWPDSLDPESGVFVYYGDNKRPGHGLHETNHGGNKILREAFSALHSGHRESIPPFLVFTKGPSGRDVFFRGLAVPGALSYSALEDLVAIWKTKERQRFQNYRSVFTILDEAIISRAWIEDVLLGKTLSIHTPASWLDWIKGNEYRPLLAPRAITHRNKQQQVPENGVKKEIVKTIIEYFKAHPQREYAFEQCAAELAVLMDKNITQYDLTRPWRDGGRDAIGKYRIGLPQNAIEVEFALEAKCKNFDSSSGVRETSRLISRLRHRQFGIFITTSYVHEQAYKEILEDGHPVVIISGADIANILINVGNDSVESVKNWLTAKFPY